MYDRLKCFIVYTNSWCKNIYPSPEYKLIVPLVFEGNLHISREKRERENELTGANNALDTKRRCPIVQATMTL